MDTNNNTMLRSLPGLISRAWRTIIGSPDVPLGGADTARGQRMPKTKSRAGTARGGRVSGTAKFDANVAVDDAIRVISESAVPIPISGQVVLTSQTLYLHHSPAVAKIINATAEPVFEAVRLGLEDWAAEHLDAAEIPVSLVGPVMDPLVRSGGVEWLSEDAHADRMKAIANRAEHESQRAEIGALRRAAATARLERVASLGPETIPLPADQDKCLGRSEELGNEAIPELTTSNRHVCIAPDGRGRHVIRDLGSSNGTTVNGVEIQAEFDQAAGRRPEGPERALCDGDVISFGRSDKAAAYVYRAATTGHGATSYEATAHFGNQP